MTPDWPVETGAPEDTGDVIDACGVGLANTRHSVGACGVLLDPRPVPGSVARELHVHSMPARLRQQHSGNSGRVLSEAI
jgi:hypothetical protein